MPADRADEDTYVSARLKKMVTNTDPGVRTVAALKFAGPGEASVSKTMLEIINHGTPNGKEPVRKQQLKNRRHELFKSCRKRSE